MEITSRNFRHFKYLLLLISFSFLSFLVGCNAVENKLDKNMVLNLKGSEDFVATGKMTSPWQSVSLCTSLTFRNLLIATGTGPDEVALDLAKSYTLSEDGLTYEFVLKDDIFWSDGIKVTPDDVVFSIEFAMLSESTDGMFLGNFSDIYGAKEFMAAETDKIKGISTNENTIIITVEKPNILLLQVFSQFVILPKHMLEHETPDTLSNSEFWRNPVVSGMYKYNEHIQGESVEFIYNDKFTGEEPYIYSVVFRSDIEIHETDLHNTKFLDEILLCRTYFDMEEHEVDTRVYNFFLFNIIKDGEPDPIMGDIRVREAIRHSIDRDYIIDKLTYGTATKMNTGITSGSSIDQIDIEYTYDIEKSKQLLNEAEYDFARPLTLLINSGTTVGYEKYKNKVIEDLENVGFTVDVLISDDFFANENDHFDVAICVLNTTATLEWYKQYYSTGLTNTKLFGGDDVFDKYIDMLNEEKREDGNEIFAEMQKLEYELLYKFPVMSIKDMVYVNTNRLEIPENVTFHDFNFKFDVDFENWKIKL